MLYYFVKSIDQTPPLDVHISCKIFAGLIPTIFSHAFNTDSFLMFPLVDSINFTNDCSFRSLFLVGRGVVDIHHAMKANDATSYNNQRFR